MNALRRMTALRKLAPRPMVFRAAMRRNFCAATATEAASGAGDAPFDIFKSGADAADTSESSGKKRTPKVQELADQILNLSLLEASELCEICQEKLAGPGGVMPMGMPMGMPMMGGAMPAAAPAAPAAGEGEEAAAEEAAPVKEESKVKALKLVGFDSAKKINVIKEIRAILGLGLKESKDLVESAPKLVKKGVPNEEADALKAKLEAAGAEVVLE